MEEKMELKTNRNYLYFQYDSIETVSSDKTGVSTCLIRGSFVSRWPFSECVRRVFKNNGMKSKHYKGYAVEVAMVTFVAHVKCDGNDEYNELKGKRIAESKCKRKIFLKLAKMASEIADETDKEVKSLQLLGGKYLELFAKEEAHARELDRIP